MAEALAEAGSAPWGVCYHAQQALEKGPKALMVANDVDPPRSHNLVVLNTELDPPMFGEEEGAFLADLTGWATLQCYPADLVGITTDEATAAVAFVRRSLEDIAARLRPGA